MGMCSVPALRQLARKLCSPLIEAYATDTHILVPCSPALRWPWDLAPVLVMVSEAYACSGGQGQRMGVLLGHVGEDVQHTAIQCAAADCAGQVKRSRDSWRPLLVNKIDWGPCTVLWWWQDHNVFLACNYLSSCSHISTPHAVSSRTTCHWPTPASLPAAQS